MAERPSRRPRPRAAKATGTGTGTGRLRSVRAEIDRLAIETAFSGVVHVHRRSATELTLAYGMADRAHRIPNQPDTRFAMGSGSKAFTALAVMSLVDEGALTLDTTARSLLAGDLPLIDDAVTVEQLLAHRSGISDYIDEDVPRPADGYVVTEPIHRLDTTSGFLPCLVGLPMKSAPGERFAYSNSGYVVLAVLAERASGRSFHDLVDERVLVPAGLTRTAYLRTDELPGDVAVGYLSAAGLRTNVLHLPVRGNGDGGAFTSAADVATFWDALAEGRIVSPAAVELMRTPRSTTASGRCGYGLGLWLPVGRDALQIEGADAGVSFRSTFDRTRGTIATVMSNVTDGARPIADRISELLAAPAHRSSAPVRARARRSA